MSIGSAIRRSMSIEDGISPQLAYISLHIDKAKSLADIIANDDNVWVKQLPVLWARGI